MLSSQIELNFISILYNFYIIIFHMFNPFQIVFFFENGNTSNSKMNVLNNKYLIW